MTVVLVLIGVAIVLVAGVLGLVSAEVDRIERIRNSPEARKERERQEAWRRKAGKP